MPVFLHLYGSDQPQPKLLEKSLLLDHALLPDCDELLVHGIQGRFVSILYHEGIDCKNSVYIGNRRDINSADPDRCFSWFPMFFPLAVPVRVKHLRGAYLNFARVVSEQSVHYEWSIVGPMHTSQIHNFAGQSQLLARTLAD
jgi:hypothetical protein